MFKAIHVLGILGSGTSLQVALGTGTRGAQRAPPPCVAVLMSARMTHQGMGQGHNVERSCKKEIRPMEESQRAPEDRNDAR